MKSCAYLFNFCVYARHSICLYLFKREKLRDSENPLQSVFCFVIAQAVNSMWYFKLSWVKFGAQNILAKIRTRLLCYGSFSLFSVNNNGVRNLTSARKLPLLNDQLQLRNQELNMSPEPIIQFYIDRKTKKKKQLTDRTVLKLRQHSVFIFSFVHPSLPGRTVPSRLLHFVTWLLFPLESSKDCKQKAAFTASVRARTMYLQFLSLRIKSLGQRSNILLFKKTCKRG